MQGNKLRAVGYGRLRKAMLLPVALAVVVLAAGYSGAWAQTGGKGAHIGYLYPAGGQQGTKVRVTAGGQDLRGVRAAYVTGTGVGVAVVEYIRNLNNKQLGDVAQHLRAASRARLAETNGGRRPNREEKEVELPELPDHPWLGGIDQMSLDELADLRDKLFDPKKQPNPQIAETVVLGVTIDPDATPGDRELRLATADGLTNPLCFQVGAWREVCEQEPTRVSPGPQPPVDPPVTLNGQIMPGDTDRFTISAKQGQRLVVQVQARRLMPYLADAVPGWFQATVALQDAEGGELAYADDYRSDPDPVLLFEVPRDGQYRLEVRDSIYRGREDFVYRIAVSEQPFITGLFPLGGKVNTPTLANVTGWNLPSEQVQLDTSAGVRKVRRASWSWGDETSNRLTYAVDDLPECNESEPNDGAQKAESMALPQTVNGRIEGPGDVDVFRFHARAGDQVVAEVYARRLGSPLDSLLSITDGAGRKIATNDDHDDREAGLLAHQADSYVACAIEQDGPYYVWVADAEGHGGPEYSYRLRVGAPRPDFALRMTPSSLAVAAGHTGVVTVHALRKDGFAGDIDVSLRSAPEGLVLSGGRIPAGRDRVLMTLTAPWEVYDAPLLVELEGRAEIGAQTVTRPVVPAEDMMQAFAYRHLVPSQELMVMVTGGKRFPPALGLANAGILRVAPGGAGEVQIAVPKRAILPEADVELVEPPDGVTLGQTTAAPGVLNVEVKVDGEKLKAGYADNLVVSVSVQAEGRDQGDGKPKRKFRVPLGPVPAVPFEVVEGVAQQQPSVGTKPGPGPG